MSAPVSTACTPGSARRGRHVDRDDARVRTIGLRTYASRSMPGSVTSAV